MRLSHIEGTNDPLSNRRVWAHILPPNVDFIAIQAMKVRRNMASVDRYMLTNSQVSLYWPPHRRHARGVLSRLFSGLRSWRLRSRQRDELARLDERELRDIGRSTADVYREAAKWFWEE